MNLKPEFGGGPFCFNASRPLDRLGAANGQVIHSQNQIKYIQRKILSIFRRLPSFGIFSTYTSPCLPYLLSQISVLPLGFHC